MKEQLKIKFVLKKTRQLAWNYCNLKQQWANVAETINQMKKKLGIDAILREERGKGSMPGEDCMYNKL